MNMMHMQILKSMVQMYKIMIIMILVKLIQIKIKHHQLLQIKQNKILNQKMKKLIKEKNRMKKITTNCPGYRTKIVKKEGINH